MKKAKKEAKQETIIEDRQPEERRSIISDFNWLIGCAVITLISVFWRFWQLELKPLHHDEGVNSFFLMTLFREGTYKYDPANYHGPDLYYLALAFSKMFGLNTISIRGSVAIFGVLTVVLAFFLKDYLGKIGSLAAALFLALSPGMVYISRYFIHEILFVFFSFGIVVGVLYFIEKRKAGIWAITTMTLLLLICFLPTALNVATLIAADNESLIWMLRLGLFAVEAILVFLIMRMILAWNDGAPIYLLLATASAVMLFATKETAFITIGTLFLAVISVWLWRKIYGAMVGKTEADEIEPVELTWTIFRERLGDNSDIALIAIACICVFAYVGILFFSSFFTYPEGVKKALEAYAIWTKTGSKEHVQNGMWAYVEWGMQVEAPIMLLSLAGTVLALVKPKSKFVMFAGLWAWGLFAAYTIIPYKTPWLAISFLMPMCIPAGYLVGELISMKEKAVRAIGLIIAVAATVVLTYQTYALNFVHYDDEDQPYVYAHTKREFLELMEKINYYAEKSGKGNQAGIQIVSPDYWPMVWYVKDYSKAYFHGKIVPADNAEMIVAKTPDQEIDVMRQYSGQYQLVGTYGLRPGVDLMLLVRSDLADK